MKKYKLEISAIVFVFCIFGLYKSIKYYSKVGLANSVPLCAAARVDTVYTVKHDTIRIPEDLSKKYWYFCHSITRNTYYTLTSWHHYNIGDTTDANGCVVVIKSKPHLLK